MLAEAADAGQAKRVADLARAAEVYARRQKLGEEAERHATRIKVDALTLMGEFLRNGPKNRGRAGKGRPVLGDSKLESPKDPTPTLAALGFTLRESSDAQALAILKDEDPDLHEKVRDGEVRIDVAAAEVRRKARERVRREKAASAQPAAPPRPPGGGAAGAAAVGHFLPRRRLPFGGARSGGSSNEDRDAPRPRASFCAADSAGSRLPCS
jgi:hypothetical protein